MINDAVRPLHVGKFVPPPYAGIEAHVDTLLRALVHVGVKATLVASEPASSRRALPALPYRLVPCRSYGTAASVPMNPQMVTVIRRELVQGRANLLHTHAPNPWGDVAALAVPRSTPVVMTWHSDIVRQKTLLRLYGPVQRKAMRRADRIVVFTPKHAESSTQLHLPGLERKIVSVPIGIDFSRLDVASRDGALLGKLDAFASGRPLIVTVGRHIYYKGYQHLVGALAKMRHDAVLAMVGTGPLTSSLRTQANSLGIGDRVLFLGEVDDTALVTVLHRADVFSLPSIEPSEAFGIASAEAMACGKPTVVCQLNNGVNYLNRDGETSLVVAPRDEPALADALDTLASDAALRHRMGLAARDWVRSEFSVDAMRERTLALYRDLL